QLSQFLDGAFEEVRGGMSRQRRKCDRRQARCQRPCDSSFFSQCVRWVYPACRAALRILGEIRGWQRRESVTTAGKGLSWASGLLHLLSLAAAASARKYSPKPMTK